MAGGHMKYRHLGRKSSHRQALLRNLVTSLFEHESITTTYPKAKEAQRLAEKLITLGKKNTGASRQRALSIFYTPHALLPKLFGPLRERYESRPGGYTRVLRLEPTEDSAPSAILELVDGPKDMRFAITARTVARCQTESKPINDITAMNISKVTRYRKDGAEALDEMVEKIKGLEVSNRELPVKKVWDDGKDKGPSDPWLLRKRKERDNDFRFRQPNPQSWPKTLERGKRTTMGV